jgi:hypothetical protein
MVKIDRKEFAEWREHPVTRTLMSFMKEERDECIKNIANDYTLVQPNCNQLIAKYAAKVEVYNEWLTAKEVIEEADAFMDKPLEEALTDEQS